MHALVMQVRLCQGAVNDLLIFAQSVDFPQPLLHRASYIDRQGPLGQPYSSLFAKQIRERTTTYEVWVQRTALHFSDVFYAVPIGRGAQPGAVAPLAVTLRLSSSMGRAYILMSQSTNALTLSGTSAKRTPTIRYLSDTRWVLK